MSATSREHEVDTAHGPVPLLVDEPASPTGTIVLAHGAGGGMRSEFMAAIARGLSDRGWRAVRFDFPYMAAGRKAPDRAPVLESSFKAVLEDVRAGGAPLVAGGKSMGGRIASLVAAQGVELSGLVYLGYPLHPPGRPERIRDAHLYEIDVPMVFVEGTRDPFCPLGTLEAVREKLPASSLVVIGDGDHSFKVRKSSGRTTADAWAEVVDRVSEWLDLL